MPVANMPVANVSVANMSVANMPVSNMPVAMQTVALPSMTFLLPPPSYITHTHTPQYPKTRERGASLEIYQITCKSFPRKGCVYVCVLICDSHSSPSDICRTWKSGT